jgi:uncharacterized membrane protein YkvA (DUF1232 family)
MRIISQIADWVTTPYTIYLILKDPAISRSVKLRAVIGLAIIFAYIISPIDIIPDFIPISGWLDDLVVVPLGLALVRKITQALTSWRRETGHTQASGESSSGLCFPSW